jgi:hypothetical protein
MSKIYEIFNKLVVHTLQVVTYWVIEYFPNILTSLIILLVGWISALLIKKITIKVLRTLGTDVISEKTGIEKYLEKGFIRKKPSQLIGTALYWLIIFGTLVVLFNTWGLVQLSGFVKATVSYIPRIIVAVLFIFLGHVFGHLLQAIAVSSSALAKIPFSTAIGRCTRYGVLTVAVMMALEELGISKSILTVGFAIVFGLGLSFIVLTLSLSLKDIVSDVLIGKDLQKGLKTGDKIRVDDHIGKIESFELTKVVLKTDKGVVFIPNSLISKKVVEKIEGPH